MKELLDAGPWILWAAAVPVVYVIGLALQVLGELLGLHSATPRVMYFLGFPVTALPAFLPWVAKAQMTTRTFYRCQEQFALLNPEQRDNLSEGLERYVVLKEASGNFALAFFSFGGALLSSGNADGQPLLVPALGGLGLLLLYSHRLHAAREAVLRIRTLHKFDKLKPVETTEMLEAIPTWTGISKDVETDQ